MKLLYHAPFRIDDRVQESECEMSTTTADRELDTSGLSCPLPVLRLKQALRAMAAGEVLHVVATDRGTLHDFVIFSKQTGHELLESREAGEKFHFWFRKGA